MKAYVPLILLAASIGLFFGFIRPQYQTVTDLRTKNDSYVEAINRAKSVGEKRDQLVAKLNSFSKDDLNRLDQILPNKVDTVKLVVDLNDIAQKHGVSISDIKTGDDKTTAKSNTVVLDAKPYSSTALTFSVTMDYKKFLDFMADLEKDLQLTDIASIDLKPSEDSSIYTFTVTVKTYWLK